MPTMQTGTTETGSVQPLGLAVESRKRALDRLREYSESDLLGAVLITGEPGAGKTWLARSFSSNLQAGWQTAEVELTSEMSPADLLELVGDQIGIEPSERLGSARLRLGSGLAVEAAEGRRWLLVVDQVQRASGPIWEEIEAINDRMGRPGGFSAVILLGRTEFVHELSRRRNRDRASRIGLHIHLPPLDLDEARELLATRGGISVEELERIHRDVMGNPRLLLRRIAASGGRNRATKPEVLSSQPGIGSIPLPETATTERGPSHLAVPGRTAPAIDSTARTDVPSSPLLPSLIPARPPIRLEDGLVEVGWEGDLDPESSPDEVLHDHPEAPPVEDARPSEEVVEDRYAALQAWAEWSRNREPSTPVTTPSTTENPGSQPPVEVETDSDAAEPLPSHPMPSASLRAEPAQEFAPYSPMFGRLRHPL